MAKSSVIGWFDKHANTVQGMTALATALIALSALIGVKVQIDSAAQNQKEQSARDIYREFLTLSISKPEFTEPDYCAIKASPEEAAYKSYVDYLLYTSEQILSVSRDWEGALSDHLEAHDQYLCSISDWSNYPDTVSTMVKRVKTKICSKAVAPCEQ